MTRRKHANWPWMTLALALAALAFQLWPGAAAWAALERAAVSEGEWWRLLSGHLSHWSWQHLGWDLLAFVVLGGLAERMGRVRLAATLIGSALAISAWFWLGEPGLASYRGLSGVDSALYVLVAADVLARGWRGGHRGQAWVAALALVGFVGKVIAEAAVGHPLFVNDQASNFAPVEMAHVVGGVVGGLMTFAAAASRHRRASCDRQ